MAQAEDRVIMISGANRGIGLAAARRLAAEGYRLSLGARDPAAIPLDGLTGALTHRWEATEPSASEAWAAATLAEFGRIDGVVMNAGVERGGDLETGDEADFDLMYEVNFKGPLRLFRACLPALRASGRGRVINLVSLAGKRVLRAQILGYAASKHAAAALTHAIRERCWADGIRATSICPGLVDTRMVEHVTAPDGQFKIPPEDVAASIAYALSLSNAASVAEIHVNSRFEHLL